MEFSDLYYYSEDSPSGLRSLATGAVAGYLDSGIGYWRVYLGKVRSISSRVVYELLYGKFDGVIDHVDGNSLNNHKDNLRATTQAINTRNRKMPACNTSGITGVVFDVKRFPHSVGETLYVKAIWVVNGKAKTKAFSEKTYGIIQAYKLAVEYRSDKILELKDCRYSDRHGM